jgi:hypothetical protein
MHQSSEYPWPVLPQTQPKKDRTGIALMGALVIFTLIGFGAGIAVLLIRNSYLFS